MEASFSGGAGLSGYLDLEMPKRSRNLLRFEVGTVTWELSLPRPEAWVLSDALAILRVRLQELGRDININAASINTFNQFAVGFPHYLWWDDEGLKGGFE